MFFTTYGTLMVNMVLAALLGLSLYLPLMAGQLSLASSGFYAVGGYTAAILSARLVPAGQPFPAIYLLLEMLAAALISLPLALLVGVPALRLRGIYLALATIAFVEVLRIVSLNLTITGGAIGISGIPQPFATPLGYLWVALPLLLLSMAFVYRLEQVRLGRALIAIREDELAAGAMGINPLAHKLLAFVLGAMLAAMVGAISAHVLNTWNTRQGTFDNSIIYLSFVLIGGSRTFAGPVAGAMLLTALPEALRVFAGIAIFPAWLQQLLSGPSRFMIYGVLIVLCTVFFPQGLITPRMLERRRGDPA